MSGSAMKEPTDLIDIGANLAHRSFHNDRKQVLERAFAAGVRTMIITGSSVAGSHEGVQIAREYPNQLFATAGVHPHDSRHFTENTIPELRQLAASKEVVAIGECGLDFMSATPDSDFAKSWPRPEKRSRQSCTVSPARARN
jgi:TatD DNase family protein